MKYPAAFPRPASEFTKHGSLPDGNDAIDPQDGMSLRDYFAAKAMAGWLSSFGDNCPHPAEKAPYAANVAALSYALADAMLAERMKGGAK